MDAAERAGAAALARFSAGTAVETKADGTPVTAADRDAERILREAILGEFPDHAVEGEEHGTTAGTAPYRWVLDPVDGTRSFIHGVPLWGTLVAVEREGVPVAGVCRMPALRETVAAAAGEGCWWNGARCGVSRTPQLAHAMLVLTSPRAARRRTPAYEELERATGFVRGWSDCYAYCLVATGRADVALDPVMQPWDCGPFLVIVEEAGGRFTDWRGRRTIRGGDAVASNGILHDPVLAILNGGRAPAGSAGAVS